jgi:K+-sensing histidine kinase KdpD
MLKTTAVAIITASLTITAATQAEEVLDMLAPEAAVAVSDINLRTIYSQAQMMSMLEDVPLEEALAKVSQDLNRPEIRYTVSGSTVRVETDWSCRILVPEDVWLRISDC